MKSPKYFKKIVAWYYRNFKYRGRTFEITFDSYKPSLFEHLYTTNGETGVYIGKSSYIILPRKKLECDLDDIPFI